MTSRSQLDIAAATARISSPEHKRFQALLQKIDKARERLASWQTQMPLFAEMHEAKAVPEMRALMRARRDFAFELEGVLGAQRWSKTDASSLRELICDLAGDLIDSEGDDDGSLKALFNRHADVDFDSAEQDELNRLKAMLEATTGLDLGDADFESADELFAKAHKTMAEAHDAVDERSAGRGHASHRPNKPKKQTAAQKRAAEDAARISQTVREVYRKLASALHPDRVSVESERALRTAQMQRANAAYEAGDLLALLSLQLEVEQVDIAHAATIAADQVRHFNKVLAEQLRELDIELQEREHTFCASFGLMTRQRLDPDKLGLLLKDKVRELAYQQALLARDRRVLQGDATAAKRWLKQWRAEQRAMDADPFF
jgi:hypothetical protein